MKKYKKFIFPLIFLVGLFIFLYPTLSNYYYRYQVSYEIESFEMGKKALPSAEVEQRLLLSHAFNRSLTHVSIEDPYLRELEKQGRSEYARMLEVNEKIGFVEVPNIDVYLPIYAGTVEEVLQKGVGHLEGTSLPVGGSNTHTVLTAHSGLPKARLFTDLNKMVLNDVFYVHTLAGTLAYQVDQILEIEPHVFDDLIVVPNEDYATLLTCTPIGINTHRLLVRGKRIPYEPKTESSSVPTGIQREIWLRYAVYALIFFFILFVLVLFTSTRKKKKRKSMEKGV